MAKSLLERPFFGFKVTSWSSRVLNIDCIPVSYWTFNVWCINKGKGHVNGLLVFITYHYIRLLRLQQWLQYPCF